MRGMTVALLAALAASAVRADLCVPLPPADPQLGASPVDGVCPSGTVLYSGPLCMSHIGELALVVDAGVARCQTPEEMRDYACGRKVAEARRALGSAYEAHPDYDAAALREYVSGRPCSEVVAGYESGVAAMAGWLDAQHATIGAITTEAGCWSHTITPPTLPSVGVCP